MRKALVAALNHVLGGEAWARERLRGFSGHHVLVAGGPLTVGLAVDGQGLFRLANAGVDEAPAVTIELPADAPFRFLGGGRESVFAAARLTGSADFAETLAFVFRNLRWDVEDDLAKAVGDIAARRLVRTGEALLGWQKRAAASVADNVAEYLSEESLVLVPARDMARFHAEVDALRDDTERLARRLACL